jgi:hypothetical protein
VDHQVSELLGLTHLPTVQAARNAKSKLLTQQTLKSMVKEPAHRPPPRLYACPTWVINTVEDLEQGVKHVCV